MENDFEKRMAELSDNELDKVLSNLSDYQPLAADAAIKEKARRDQKKAKPEKENQNTTTDNSSSNREEENRYTDTVHAISFTPEKETNKRYPILHFISGLYRILAWIVGIGSCIAFIVTILQANRFSSYVIMPALGILLAGAIVCITLLAISEGIKVFIDIEYNTRITASKK